MKRSGSRPLPRIGNSLPIDALPPVCAVEGCGRPISWVLVRSDERLPRSGMCDGCRRLFGVEVVRVLYTLNRVVARWIFADSGALRLLARARAASKVA